MGKDIQRIEKYFLTSSNGEIYENVIRFVEKELIEKALGYAFEGFDRTIDVHILNLRRKLETDPSHPSYIKTVYGAGYKFSEVQSGP